MKVTGQNVIVDFIPHVAQSDPNYSPDVINPKLRNLLQDKSAQNVVESLYKAINKKGVLIYLPEVTAKINDFFANSNQGENYPVDTVPDECFDQPDFNLIKELKALGKLKLIYATEDDEGGWVAMVEFIDKPFIQKFHKWVIDIDHITTYKIFSLNLYTGETYCGNNETNFRPSSGTFRVFKEFLVNKKHQLTYRTICALYENRTEEEIETNYPYDNQPEKQKRNPELSRKTFNRIKEIKDKLDPKRQLPEFFLAIGNSYKLLSGEN